MQSIGNVGNVNNKGKRRRGKVEVEEICTSSKGNSPKGLFDGREALVCSKDFLGPVDRDRVSRGERFLFLFFVLSKLKETKKAA